jgi:polysaccharide export outer membrane protein
MGQSTWAAILLGTALTGLGGCEVDSFMDPSVVGRWERTPVTLPILERLDVIDEPPATAVEATSVRVEDLVPDVREYIIGPSDLVLVTVFELISPGQEAIQARRVDETGSIRLPIVGTVQAAGLSPSQLETKIADILETKGVLRDPTVSVVLQEARQNTFSIIGEPGQGSTAFGTYAIPKPDFRLVDALALARGISERTKTLTIIRQTALTPEVAGELPGTTAPAVQEREQAPADSTELIEQLMEGLEEQAPGEQPEQPEQPAGPQTAPNGAPSAIEQGLGTGQTDGQWINVGDEWVRVQVPEQPRSGLEGFSEADQAVLQRLVAQRLIQIPYDQLIQGAMRYNVVIRPGDIIRVPARAAGFVYIMGQVNRPGAYTVPGENELTLKQLVASTGNLGGLAVPERVDLIRRIDGRQEAVLRLDLREIFAGTQPDIFLKPNDLVNVGTNFVATPLAIFRNGLRTTYGFGFVLDRNFSTEVFGR